jgi:glycosyltransferase involved in cell wall biosynthesis
LLIDPNHPTEIALAVEKLLSDEKLAERIGECGRQTIIEKFSIDLMVDQSLDFYADVQKSLLINYE